MYPRYNQPTTHNHVPPHSASCTRVQGAFSPVATAWKKNHCRRESQQIVIITCASGVSVPVNVRQTHQCKLLYKDQDRHWCSLEWTATTNVSIYIYIYNQYQHWPDQHQHGCRWSDWCSNQCNLRKLGHTLRRKAKVKGHRWLFTLWGSPGRRPCFASIVTGIWLARSLLHVHIHAPRIP